MISNLPFRLLRAKHWERKNVDLLKLEMPHIIDRTGDNINMDSTKNSLGEKNGALKYSNLFMKCK